MTKLYDRRKQRGDLLVKVYVPRKLIEKTEASMRTPPMGALHRKHWRHAFQSLVESLLWANEHQKRVDVPDELAGELTLSQLMADLDDQVSVRKSKSRKKRGT